MRGRTRSLFARLRFCPVLRTWLPGKRALWPQCREVPSLSILRQSGTGANTAASSTRDSLEWKAALANGATSYRGTAED
eukprot:15345233-Alexandrium_andersonii.AAC.1